MLKTLIEKELKAILSSPKFVTVFTVCSILVVLSVYIGIDEYRTSVRHYETVNAQLDQQIKEQTRWSSLRLNIVRRPDPMHIFVTGVNNDIGRQSPIIRGDVIKLYGSRYSDQLLFSIFRSLDLMFIVQVVLSLFAILFTYDSICGEREAGTLKLNFANPIPRTTYIMAKIAGSWLGLMTPLIIPLAIGIAFVLIYRIPMTTAHWISFLLIIFMSGLYLSFFICLGVLFSSFSKVPSSSFLYLLVIWIGFVLIIPRAGVMTSGYLISVPTAAEISTKLNQKRSEVWREFNEWQTGRWRELNASLAAMSNEEQEKKYDEVRSKINKEMSERYDKMNEEIDKYHTLLNEEWRNRKLEQERLGFSISRFSPASAFQLAAMELSGTGLSLKTGYEDQLQVYKEIFSTFIIKKEEKSGGLFNQLSEDRKPEPIDIREIPQFIYINPGMKHVLQSTVIDIGIISFYILLTIAGTFIAFIRYDVR
jgi:ABC-type transport system involved in multi-copper enzyme maturation permease subunit